ncbi:MAG: Na/Pi cotransporter family protein [Opitutaceae bacterium]|nr:Na/Pi cotransporter family protein [Opitutaceae bacterium]
MIAQLLGGIGLFLLGMLLLTDGLKAAAGEALKRILVRFTGRTATAFFSGLTVTAMVQSSSATTLATIGFVSAGLLTFSQAIGVVIGGSVGTTTTGWIVSILGLKLSVGQIAMPLIGIGALMRLVLKDRPAAAGLALAGFGLIFVGIEILQLGMAGVSAHVEPANFPGATLGGRLLLILIGIALTVVMQSSSAVVATVITAFHAGSINLEQALTLIVGASIGTTVTSALAAIGASVPAKRTALVHILFNTLSAALGFLLLPVYVWLIRRLAAADHEPVGASSLAVFHTAFHLLGAAIVLPTVHRFAGIVTRLLPDRGPAPTRHLDDSLIQVPEVALEALRRALADCAGECTALIRQRIEPAVAPAATQLDDMRRSLRDARTFLARIPAATGAHREGNARLSIVHALDHLDQLTGHLEKPAALTAADAGVTGPAREKLHALVGAAGLILGGGSPLPPVATLEQLARELADLRRTTRHALLEETAGARLAPEEADALLDLVRWMDTVAYHLWRTVHHLQLAAGGKETAAAREYPEPPAA